MHHFVLPDRRNGPFLVQFTDTHQSNVFVDDDWNVTCMLDLEWICALPVEMLAVHYWLTDCTIDDIIGSEYGPFDQARQAFLAAMDEETKATRPAHNIPIIHTMQDSWSSKAVWFWPCITSINGWLFIFEDHILPKFGANIRLDSRPKAGLGALDGKHRRCCESQSRRREVSGRTPFSLCQPRNPQG
ncbi:hypothetical protein VTK56DRAFT_1478 [Thermocarpiscus australiensis]